MNPHEIRLFCVRIEPLRGQIQANHITFADDTLFFDAGYNPTFMNCHLWESEPMTWMLALDYLGGIFARRIFNIDDERHTG